MKKLLVAIILAVFFTPNLFAADIGSDRKNTKKYEEIKIAMTIDKAMRSNEKGGNFANLVGQPAILTLTTDPDGSITRFVLEYSDEGRLTQRVFNNYKVEANKDCSCIVYEAEIPEGEVNDHVVINLTRHRCSKSAEKTYTAVVTQDNGWSGKKASSMELSGNAQ